MKKSLLTVTTIMIVSAFTFAIVMIILNFENIVFAIRRPDYIDAARQVEEQERQQIQEEIERVKKQSIKKILSPLVINETEE